MNALSFDIEDYFHVSNFESFVKFEDWDRFESRVEGSTGRILDLLSARGVKATFFILGWVAQKFPHLVQRIAAAGHELGTHSYRHRLVYSLTPEQFREDLRLSIRLIEDAGGKKVIGHRAPSFSITGRSLWAIDILQQEGLLYDSSIFPVRHPRYGIPDAPLVPHEIRPGFWEFPMTALRIGKFRLPVAGGGYFRLYPFSWTRWSIRRLNGKGQPAMVYLHPWEFDPDQPRLKASLQARFRHYNNLHKTARRLDALLGEFPFRTASEALGLP